ncbi:MAG: hypothetical protein ACI9LM_005306 [Alteromonadaceae bacterium]|jgi:hypothetical protein
MNNIDLSKSMPITCAFSCESNAYLITIRQQAAKIAEIEANQVKAESLIVALHEQVYDNSHLDKQVELYFTLEDQGK